MEAKFDPKAKVKQGQFSDAPDGKQPNREHTNIDFEKHAPRKYESANYLEDQDYLLNQELNMFKIHCLKWLTKKITNESWA